MPDVRCAHASCVPCASAPVPLTFLLCAGGLLKEAVDDLEWPGGSVSIRLNRDPAGISMAATGTGSLEVGSLEAGVTCYLSERATRLV